MKSLKIRIYQLILKIYHVLVWLYSLFNKKAKLWMIGRQHWQVKLKQQITKDEHWIWFHCSSLGEYEDCSELFKMIKEHYSTHKILLTFFSPTAIEYFKEDQPFDALHYLPLDSKKNAAKFISIVQPEFVFFSRSELWLFYLKEVKVKMKFRLGKWLKWFEKSKQASQKQFLQFLECCIKEKFELLIKEKHQNHYW